MGLSANVAAAFGDEGPLAQTVAEYRPREGQIRMATAVADTLEAGGMLVVEAGTGVGKTYAYLVPALLSGQRVLVSTATKALQDQLFCRDIPHLRRVLGISARVALLKGRSSYLCLNRLETARQDWRMEERTALQHLARIESWAHSTQSGDLAEVDALVDSSPLLPLVTSTRENCLGARCPQAPQCFVNRARREALAADVVVINHHLFFADLNVRESGVAELLPSVHAVVFDEAHQLNDIGVQFLGRHFGTGQLSSLARDLEPVAREHARGLAPWAELAAAIEQGAQTLRDGFASSEGVRRLDWRAADAHWAGLLETAGAALREANNALARVAEMAPELQVLHNRVGELQALLDLFMQPVPGDSVRWLEVGRQVRMLQSPLDISAAMRARVLPEAGHALGARKAWVFTSATLGHDASLSWIVETCGLAGAHILRVPSPFDYGRQASLYIPKEFPKPGDARHSAAVAELARQGAQALGGRTLVLTTTLRAMRAIGDALYQSLRGSGDLEVLVQGTLPKRELLERFLQTGPHMRGRVLVASATFWEGIDMPGEALQLLVIDKLPFTPPDDPLLQARSRALEEQGRSAFRHLHLPQAAVALRQGAGRLIRRESDQGVLVVCDLRLNQMGYGRQLVAALPPMHRLLSAAEFLDRLASLTRTSTTDRLSSAPPW